MNLLMTQLIIFQGGSMTVWQHHIIYCKNIKSFLRMILKVTAYLNYTPVMSMAPIYAS